MWCAERAPCSVCSVASPATCGDGSKTPASQGSANGSASGRPEAPKFGQLAGRSVVNIPSDYHPFSFYSLKPALGCCHSFLAPLCGRGSRDVGRTRFGNRARVVGLARSPRMQTPTPTTKLLLARLADGDGPEGHLVKFLKKIFAARGDATRPRPAPPRQSSANWPGNRRPEPSGRPYRPCFSHSPAPDLSPPTHPSRSKRPSPEQRPARCWPAGAPARDRAPAAG